MITPAQCGLPETAIANICSVLGHHCSVETAILCGSRAMGTHRPGSDIDIVLTGDIAYTELRLIETELDELMLPFKIDISLLEQIG